MIAYGGVFNSTHFGILVFLNQIGSTNSKIENQIEKQIQIMASFTTPTGFFIFYETLFFCPHIAESVNIAKVLHIAVILKQKSFGDIGSPPVL